MRMDERGGKGMKAKDRRTRQREEEEGGDEGEGSKRGQRKSNKQLHIGLITPPPPLREFQSEHVRQCQLDRATYHQDLVRAR